MKIASASSITGQDLVPVIARIVSAYVENNTVALVDLPGLIANVQDALVKASRTAAVRHRSPEPAVPIEQSITPDALISLIDGKPYKTLKRHLTQHGLTMREYREHYGLPFDYPSTAPNYSAQRSELARAKGFGQVGRHRAVPVDELNAESNRRASSDGVP